MAVEVGDSGLAERLRKNLRGAVLFDKASRGRYSTDASIYQIEPIGVVVPRDKEDVAAAITIAREAGVPRRRVRASSMAWRHALTASDHRP